MRHTLKLNTAAAANLLRIIRGQARLKHQIVRHRVQSRQNFTERNSQVILTICRMPILRRKIINLVRGTGNMRVNENTAVLIGHSTHHSRHLKRQSGTQTGGKRLKNKVLRLKPHAGIGATRSTYTPATIGRIHNNS